MEIETAPTTRTESIAALARTWGIADDWDLLLVGDGSGSGWNLPGGWACVLIDAQSGRRQRVHGGMSLATARIAELMPYVHALTWYVERRRRRKAAGLVRVHIVTDDQGLVTTGHKLREGTLSLADLGSTRPYWAALLAFAHDGVDLHYHWVPRQSFTLNCFVDALSKASFRAMKEVAVPSADGRPVSIYDGNPHPPRT